MTTHIASVVAAGGDTRELLRYLDRKHVLDE